MVGAGRERAPVPDHHDARVGGGAGGAARSAGAADAEDRRPRLRPDLRAVAEKTGITLGMGMTEKQGGTDVRANTTRAEPRRRRAIASPATNGSCRRRCATRSWCWRRRRAGSPVSSCRAFAPDGSVNALHFQRLKDKLGNRSNASSEVEFADAYALRVGDEGEGIRTIIQMVQLTRLDCAIASAGMMRVGAGAGAASRAPSQRVPEASRRPAADAGGAGRHGAACRGARSRW